MRIDKPSEEVSPFFSVIIPVYNKEQFLASTLDSVLGQSFDNFELVLVLDPSTDRSNEIVRTYEDPRIRIYSRTEPGPGGYAARNLGIKEARSEWIAFLDADDLWTEHHLRNLHREIIARGTDVGVVCTGYLLKRRGTLSDSSYLHKFRSTGSHQFDLIEFLRHKPLHTINSAIRKSILESIGGFPEGRFLRGGDYETWLRVLLFSKKGYWISEATAVYNKDVEDGVIKSSLPYTFGHPVLLKVLEILPTQEGDALKHALKKYSNSFVIVGVKRRLKLGCLTVKDVRALFGEAYENKKQLFAIRVFSCLPFWLQRVIAKLQ